MMNKLIGILLLTASFSIHAGENNKRIWENIRDLHAKINNLQTQINHIPEGRQGIPGPQGSQGIKGEQGIKGDRGEPGGIGKQGEQGQPGKYSAGDGIIIEGDVIKAIKQNHHIGDEYQSGVVFYVDETGQHGLIASKIDVTEQGISWRNGASGNKVTNARGDGIGAGETNTRLIIAQQTIDNQKGSFAALSAANFQILGDGVTPCKTPIALDNICYGGWYLPSAFELNLLYTNLHEANLTSFAPEFYWSSTEADVANAWLINFSTGELMPSNKSNTIGRVRAIAHF